MPSVSLAEAVVQQTAIIEEARLRLMGGCSPEQAIQWWDLMHQALLKIDELCLRRMQESTYEMLRRQQKALLASLKFPEQARG